MDIRSVGTYLPWLERKSLLVCTIESTTRYRHRISLSFDFIRSYHSLLFVDSHVIVFSIAQLVRRGYMDELVSTVIDISFSMLVYPTALHHLMKQRLQIVHENSETEE